METACYFGEMFDELVERPDGKWMLFSDHAAAANLLRAEIAVLKQRCEEPNIAAALKGKK
jgi:hypothetical protein